MYNIDTTASCNVLFLLLTALGRKVMKSVVSVCPFVFILPFEPVDFWRWFFACVWVITITRRGLKIKIIGQGQRLGCIYYIRLARTVTWSVWPRSSIDTSLPDCVFTWKKTILPSRIVAFSTTIRPQFMPALRFPQYSSVSGPYKSRPGDVSDATCHGRRHFRCTLRGTAQILRLSNEINRWRNLPKRTSDTSDARCCQRYFDWLCTDVTCFVGVRMNCITQMTQLLFRCITCIAYRCRA